LIKKHTYKIFADTSEAEQWALDNYGDWLSEIQKEYPPQTGIAYLLFAYSGAMNIIYNKFLHGVDHFDEEEIEKYSGEITIIDNELRKFELPENILVYRYTNKKWFRWLFKDSKPKVGNCFTDKGFMSTTLVEALLKSFAKKYEYNCILELYLPKGTKGVYIRFNDCLNEQEFLLPPNSTFRLIKKRYKGFTPVYECVLESQ